MSKVMCVDSGLASIGVAIMKWDGREWRPTLLKTLYSKPADKLLEVRQSSDCARRIEEQSRALAGLIHQEQIAHLVAELPDTGAQSADALRAMMLGMALLVSTVEHFKLIKEYYTPYETRAAAKVPRGVRKGNEVKKFVIANMRAMYPELETVRLACDREHAADALACFEAARNGNIVRGLQI